MRTATRAPAPQASRRTCPLRAIASSERKTARLQFSVPKRVHFGHSVCLVGSHEAVGTWDTSKGVVLQWRADDNWVGEVEVPVGTSFEYKYFTQAPGGRAEEWQPGNNLALEAPREADAVLLVTDDWHGKERSLDLKRPGADQPAGPPATAEGPAEPAAVAAAAASPDAAAAKPTNGAAAAADNGASQNGNRTVWHPAPSSSNGSSSNGNGAYARAAPQRATKPPQPPPAAPAAAPEARSAAARQRAAGAAAGGGSSSSEGEAGARRRRKQAALLEALAAEPAAEDARVQARRARLWDSSGSDSDAEGGERPPMPPAAASGSESSDEESIDAALRGADAVKELAAQLLGRQREVLGRLHEADFGPEAASFQHEAAPDAAPVPAAVQQAQADALHSLAAAREQTEAAAAVTEQQGSNGSGPRRAAAEQAEAGKPVGHSSAAAAAEAAAAADTRLSEQQLSALTVKQLKARAKAQGMLQTGKKADLVARLLAAQPQQ